MPMFMQGDDLTTQFKTSTVTNWIKPGPYLCMVNGQLYNTYYSQLWGEPIGGPLAANNGHPIRYETIPQDIRGTNVFCDIYGTTYWYETYTGQEQDESRELYKTVVVYNAPTNIVLGLPYKFHCMKVGDLIESNRFICEAYDCGTVPTNLIPVVKKVRVKITGNIPDSK
jgi:hypothetical protein